MPNGRFPMTITETQYKMQAMTTYGLNFRDIKNLLIKKNATYRVSTNAVVKTVISLKGNLDIASDVLSRINIPGYAAFISTPANGRISAMTIATNNAMNVNIITYDHKKFATTEYTDIFSK